MLSGADGRPAVLQVIGSLDAGGSERSAVDMAKGLVEDGWRALVASEGGRTEPELINAGAETIRLPMRRTGPLDIAANARALTRLIRERRIALVHAHSRGPAWSAFIAARATGIPWITTYHNVFQKKGLVGRHFNSVMARGDAVIANSEFTARHVRQIYSFRPKRLTVIPQGADMSYFDPDTVAASRIAAFRERYGFSETERIVLLPGRLDRWKGRLVLVRALALMQQSGRLPADVRALIAGADQGRIAYRAEIAHAILECGMQDVAILSDHIDDMAAAYQAATIIVSPSIRPEAFGRVPPEAAAMRRPVIATDHGGARETVLAGESGLLVKPGDPAALAEGLASLLSRPPEALAQMGRTGRAHVAAYYDAARMCRATIELYRELLSARAREPKNRSRVDE